MRRISCHRSSIGLSGCHSAAPDEAEAGGAQGAPRRNVVRIDRHDEARHVGVRRPDLLDELLDHRRAEPLPSQRRIAEEVVDARRTGRHLDERDELVAVRRIVVEPRILDQSDGPPGEQDEPVLARLGAVGRGAEIAFQRLGVDVVVPPTGDVRLGQEAREQREIRPRHPPERELAHHRVVVTALDSEAHVGIVEHLPDADGVAEGIANAEVDAVGRPVGSSVMSTPRPLSVSKVDCASSVVRKIAPPIAPFVMRSRTCAAVASSMTGEPGRLEEDLAAVVARDPHGEPAHEAEVDVGGHLESEVVRVEVERFVLIEHEELGAGDVD